MRKMRFERDSIGEIEVEENCLWGAQTQRSLEHFSIGDDLIPSELIVAYAQLKKAAAHVNAKEGRISKTIETLIVRACDEIIEGKYREAFPLYVWMTGSGTQFNMNMNEVIGNLCSQYTGEPLGSKRPVHPNDHVNMSQSSNDTFPTAMHMSAAFEVVNHLLPRLAQLRNAIQSKAEAWADLVKIGRTHLQDATPLTLGQEFSGYTEMLTDNITRLEMALNDVYKLVIGGTAVGTGINAEPGFDAAVAKEIARLTDLPFVAVKNKFSYMGAHDALVQLSGTLKTLAGSLYKIANDIALLASGPRSGINELILPANEPGSSIMPGKVNPTQCEALAMVAVQVMANDYAVTLGGAGGMLEMNVYKPLMIHNILHSIRILSGVCHNFRIFCVEGMEPNRKEIAKHVERSLMLVTALAPVIGYDKASELAHYALVHDITLREAALKLNYVSAEEYDRVVDPLKMVHPYVAK